MKQRKILKTSTFLLIYAAVIMACAVLDQLTKLWIFDGLLEGREGASLNILGSFLCFDAVYNEGAAFGIATDDGANIVFFVITLLGVPLFCMLLLRSRTRSICGQIGYAFVIGGTLGNAYDRAFVASDGTFFGGKVRDFISFSFFPPVFNVADSFLTVGVALAILALLFFDPDGLLAMAKDEASKARKIGTADGNDAKADLADAAENFCNDTLTTDDADANGDDRPNANDKANCCEQSACEEYENTQNGGDVHEKN